MDLVNLDVTISDEFHCYTELFVEVGHGRYHGHLAGNQFLWNDRNWTVGYAYQTHGSPGSTEPNRRLDGVGQASTFDDGICAGAGAILAMASDLRYGTAAAKVAFLFNRVGLAGCDMGACAILPRIIGQGRASDLLYTGRSMSGEEGERWGFFNRLCDSENLLAEAQEMAARLANGPSFANAMTKRALHQEWTMGIDEAIEAEAQSQAICMMTKDYKRAYDAFVAKEKPAFEGN